MKKNVKKKNNNLKKTVSPTSSVVKIKSITERDVIITDGIKGQFNIGVLYPINIIYDKAPVPVDISTYYIKNNFRAGVELKVSVIDIIDDDSRKIGILSADISGFNDDDDSFFEQLKVGVVYEVNVFSIENSYLTVRFPDTSLRGYLLINDLKKTVQVGDKIKLRLVLKGKNTFQMMKFIDPSQDITGEQIIVETDPEVAFREMFTPYELTLISDEDHNWLVKKLALYPNLDRHNKFIEDIDHIYCRYSLEHSLRIREFFKQHPDYLTTHNFWVSYNKDEDTLVFYNSEYFVMKMSFKPGEEVVLQEFYHGKHDIRAKYIVDSNKYNRLQINGYKIHLVDMYEAIPHTFDVDAIGIYLETLIDFYYSFLPNLRKNVDKQKSVDYADFNILKDLIIYERELELRKHGQRIEITSESSIQRTAPISYNDGTAFAFDLPESQYNILKGRLDEDEELYVSLVDPKLNDKPLRSGKLTYDEEKHKATLEFIGKLSMDSEKMREGFFLKKKSSIEHLNLQIDILKSLQRKNEKAFASRVLPVKFEKPDISDYENIQFFDEKIKNASEGNNQPIAVKKALGNKGVLLIQGPPGTGKTTVIVEIIRQLVKEGKKVLVCSQAHAAVNNIVEKLQSIENIDFISIGNEGEEDVWGKGFNQENYRRFLKNNILLIRMMKEENPELTEEYIKKNFTYDTKIGERYVSFHLYLLQYFSEHTGLYTNAESILEKLLDKCNLSAGLLESYRYQSMDVILGTCIGLGMNHIMGRGSLHFDTVIIDEAAKANLAESLVPIKMGSRCVLVGDDKQLPPYSDRNELEGLVEYKTGDQAEEYYEFDRILNAISKSYFEEIHDLLPEENVVMLNYQYRMHPEIGKFISNIFYEELVNMGENTMSQYISVPAPYDDTVIFDDTYVNDINKLRDKIWEKKRNNSYYNIAEAEKINNVLEVLEKADLPKDTSIAIISPYSEQCSYLRNKIRDEHLKKCIYTIDSIQGMEFDIVIFSFVRSFPKGKGKVGFLDDMRRLNVSLSRAKKKLILIGNKQTLTDEEAHRDSAIAKGINPLTVFESLTDSYLCHVKPSKGRIFMEKYNGKEHLEAIITKKEGKYVYFDLEDDKNFNFRMPLETHQLYQLSTGDVISIYIDHYSPSYNPIFKLIGRVDGNHVEKLKDFEYITRKLACGKLVDVAIHKDNKSGNVSVTYEGCYCILDRNSCPEDFLEGFFDHDTIKARVFSINNEEHKIVLYPVLDNYEELIDDSLIKHFFIEIVSKEWPDNVTVRFDNGWEDTFKISNSFHWYALRKGSVHTELWINKYNSRELVYKNYIASEFAKKHSIGDKVIGSIELLNENSCIVWVEGVPGKLLDFKSYNNLEVGDTYYMQVADIKQLGNKVTVTFKIE